MPSEAGTVSLLRDFFLYLGEGTAIYFAFTFLLFIKLQFRTSTTLPRYHHGRPGKTWALVTGASDGIGHGFAQELCAAGFNVLLHGRNASKLGKIQEALEEAYPTVQVSYVVADAASADADIDGIVEAARALPGKLTILVNNVGGQHNDPLYGALTDIDAAYMDSNINVNARFPAQLTRALMSLLMANAPSLVITMGSVSSIKGIPFLATYSGTKAFNLRFSEAVKCEMLAANADVEVLGLLVGNTLSNTNTTAVQGFTCSSRDLAKHALNKVGCGKAVVWAWWRHAVQGAFVALLPHQISESAITNMMKGRKAETDKKE